MGSAVYPKDVSLSRFPNLWIGPYLGICILIKLRILR